MTDREKAGLRGAVRRVVSESFFVDYQTKVMPDKGRREETAYLSDGRLDEQVYGNPHGSSSRSTYVYGAGGRLVEVRSSSAVSDHVTHYTYDDQGRLARLSTGPAEGPEITQETYSYGSDGTKTRVYFVPAVPKPAPGTGMVSVDLRLEGSVMPMGGAGAATVTTVYDVSGSPKEALMHNDRHQLLARIEYSRDQSGRIVEETVEAADTPIDGPWDQFPEETRAALQRVLVSHVMRGRATHKYDEAGNEIELTRTIGELQTETRRTRYDEYGNKLAEESESLSRQVRFDPDAGAAELDEAKNQVYRSSWRYEYEFDEHRNWVRQTQWSGADPGQNDFRSMLVKRTLTYF